MYSEKAPETEVLKVSEQRWQQLSEEARGKIVRVLVDLEQRRLKAKTIRNYKLALVALALKTDLQNVNQVARIIESIQGTAKGSDSHGMETHSFKSQTQQM